MPTKKLPRQKVVMSSTQSITLEGIPHDPVYIQMMINGKRLSMELDTGPKLFIISEKTRQEILPEEKL